ncbi:MAG: Trk system potassium transporter TrkA [Deltaproteobacteria bacterium]|nr:MAG: Trk system potassium transporter TrkA [Deltaproteobacteria bacterium]
MYVVVIGLGQVGRHVVKTLERSRHDVVAIDNDTESVGYIDEHHDVMSLQGYGASSDVLRRAGADRADLVVACTNNDEVNLIASLAARRMGAKRAIARVQGSEWAERAEGIRYDLLGVDVVINPLVLVAQEIAKIARSHGALEVVDLANDRIELVQVQLDENCRMLHKTLAKLSLPKDILIAAIVRDGDLEVPGGADVLLPGDRIYMIGKQNQMMTAEDLFTRESEARRVAIVGGGVVGEALARMLIEDGAHVMIIEQDKARAKELTASLPGAELVHGDGTDLTQLEEEEIGNYDLFVAVSDEDEVNLMAGLLAKRAGARRTVALVHRPDYSEIYKQLGIDVVLSPRVVASDHILRYSRETELKSLTILEDGKAEVLEFIATAGSRGVGVPMHRINLPRGALIGAVVHRDRVIIPKGDDIIHEGDTVILLTKASARPAVERLFKQRAL